MLKRVQRMIRLVGKGTGGLLVTSPENVRYLSGFSGTEGTLLIAGTKRFFITDGRYTTQAKKEVKGFAIITAREKWKEIWSLIKKMRVSSLGFESKHLTVAMLKELEKEAPGLRLVPCADKLDGLRLIKDAEEIKIMRKAALIAAESLSEALQLIRPGISEIDIASELEFRMRKRGGEASAFATIVASGPRSALPHGTASRKKIRRGELLVIDFGAVYQGYCSDETCTFCVGEPTLRQRHIYDAVKKAHDLAVRKVSPGRPLIEIDAAARAHIARQGYEKYFNHGTGHGIGLCVHEAPAVSLRSTALARKGMLFTVEPGVYVPGWGGVRIEDTVVVTARGCEVITASDKKLTVVGQ